MVALENSRLLCLLRALAVAATVFWAGSASGGNMITVYFLPFEIETYVPVTADTVECDAHEVWQIKDSQQSARLLGLLRNDDSRVDPKRIRAKIVSPGKTFLVDSAGVATDGESRYRLDLPGFLQLREDLAASAIKAVQRRDCRQKSKGSN